MKVAQFPGNCFFLSGIFFRRFQTLPPGCPAYLVPYAASSLIVHTIWVGRFRFDCTVSLTVVCGQRKEGAVMVFILSKIKCFFRLLQSAALQLTACPPSCSSGLSGSSCRLPASASVSCAFSFSATGSFFLPVSLIRPGSCRLPAFPGLSACLKMSVNGSPAPAVSRFSAASSGEIGLPLPVSASFFCGIPSAIFQMSFLEWEGCSFSPVS